ncbi:translocation/assembly module TamB domain-containing protein [Spirulina sp. CS-785/01]|uniref:translocation/assembly module TamB domain-containing protein n=1 Tax=Spirulina sp. CS-785/01 TaxID=3021716 RepID=UPI00232F709C|nr:translocation/assembly module TamB domain-containing protein [Spirulina sp. CS-785/01]MDB9312059.1 translocation/assembly module TamB domain-containing protein [Spirulina sp. CS-785/01]
MTHPPNEPQPRRNRKLWAWLTVILLIAAGGSVIIIWALIQQYLRPTVEQSLETNLQRPVELGNLLSFSPTGLRFGETHLPPTQDDPDQATVSTVAVRFNPLTVLTQNRLGLNVSLVGTEVYIEQSLDGSWITIPQPPEQDPLPIDIELDSLRVFDGSVTLMGRYGDETFKQPVQLNIPSATVTFADKLETILLENLKAKLVKGGTVTATGEVTFAEKKLDNLQGKVAVTAENLSLPELKKLAPRVPLEFISGTVGGNVTIELEGNPLTQETWPQVTGVAQVQKVEVDVDNVPNNIRVQEGTFQLADNVATLDNIRGQLGNITAVARGDIGVESGFAVSLNILPVNIETILTTFELDSQNIPVSGEIEVAADITGQLTNPIIRGRLNKTATTFKLDEVPLDSLAADFSYQVRQQILAVDQVTATPSIGGTVRGEGRLVLNDQQTALVTATAENVPSQGLASLYDVTLPVNLNTIEAQAKAVIPLQNWQNLQATVSSNTVLGGGSLTAREIQVNNGIWQGTVQASEVNISQFLELPAAVRGEVGTATATLALRGSLENFSPDTVTVSGNGFINVAGGMVRFNELQLGEDRQLSVSLRSSGVQVGRIVPAFAPENVSMPPLGALNGNFDLTGRLAGFMPEMVQGSGFLSVGVAGGTVAAREVQWQGDQLTARLSANSLGLGQLSQLVSLPASLPINRGSLGEASGEVQVALTSALWEQPGTSPQDYLNTLQVNGSGRVTNLARGTAQGDFSLENGKWQANLTAQGLQPHTLTPQVPPQLQGVAGGQFQVAGRVNNLTIGAIRASGSGDLQLAGGRVTVTGVELANGTLSANLTPQGVQLGRFSSRLRGSLGGDVQVAANLINFSPRDVTAEGNVTLSEGVSVITRPVDAGFAWDGQRLSLSQVDGGNQLQASGEVEIDVERLLTGDVVEGIALFDLNLDVNNINFATLQQELEQYVSLPVDLSPLNLRGEGSFQGTVQGTIPNPSLTGHVILANVAANQLVLDPRLTGEVQLDSNGGIVALSGDTDRLELRLDGDYLPTAFEVKLDEFTATGDREGRELVGTFNNFPLPIIKSIVPLQQLPPVIAAQPVQGMVSGNAVLNLNTLATEGRINITQPVFGLLQGDQFNGHFLVQNDTITLDEGNLQRGETQYQITGRLTNTFTDPRLQGKIAINNGDIQDVFTTFKIKDLQDIQRLATTWQTSPTGQAADLNTIPVGLSVDASIEDRLRRFSEIITLVARSQAQQQEAIPLPSLQYLTGEFNGEIAISTTFSEGVDGVNADLTFTGNNWQWGNFQASNVAATANLEEGILTLLPLELQSGGGSVVVSGAFGTENLSGQLKVTEFPIASLQDLIPLPPAVGFGGRINATASIGGTQTNPQSRGRITITDASVNDTPINTAESNFSYNNARLSFSAKSILAEEGTPLTLTGSIPYRLPLPNATPPQDNSLQLQANLEDDGLALLNILTRQQLAWQQGEGVVDVEVSGTINPSTQQLTSLVAQGNASFTDGVVTSRVLPNAVTDLNGEVQFNFDRIEVEELTGQYGGGDIVVTGVLPTTIPQPQDTPLTVSLEKLALNLKGLLNGEVEGNIIIAGAALEPEISGNVEVNQGRLELGGTATANNLTSGEGEEDLTSRVSFNNLIVQLGEKFAISQRPLLEFLANGELTVNGTLDSPQVVGDIALKRGYVDLFTTTLRLDSNYDNVARFVPRRDLDPELDIRLVGNVLEASRSPVMTNAINSEVSTTAMDVGTVQTIRVEAIMEGTASELIASLNNPQTGVQARQVLQLESTPSRSETEIIALMGGGFINAVAGGDNTALVGGLANLASNALLSDVQYAISEAFGLSSFAIFPAEVIDEEEGRTGTLGVAMEVGKDFGDRVSVSALQYITPPEQPTRFNVRYRINDQFTVRGSTDFRGDSRAVLEFETRF